MKKVLLKAYLCNNLGDDIFAYILSKRYLNDFYTYEYKKNKSLLRLYNFHYKESFFDRIVDMFFSKLFKKYNYTETKNKLKYDLLVYIGGSIFIESNNIDFWNYYVDNYSKNYIPYYILGCNFGPWVDKRFPKLIENKIFSNASDVCFRDSFSFNLFSINKNVRLDNDIIFDLKKYIDTGNNKSSKTVVFSIINLKEKNDNYMEYEDRIVETINDLDKMGYDSVLMSFCRREGDEKAVSRIYKRVSQLKRVRKYFYRGNIEEALLILNSSKIIFGSRFHANIIGIALDKYIIPFSYSKKINNVLQDLKFKGKIFDIDNIKEMTITDILNNIESYRIHKKPKSEGQFEKLDKILEVRKVNE